MSDVFISYSSHDREKPQFEGLLKDLTTLRRDYWRDTADLKGGLPWWEDILRQIQGARIVVPVLTKASLRSVACRRELDWTEALHRKILPVRLEDVPIPADIEPLHVIDYTRRHVDPDAAGECAVKLSVGLAALDALPDSDLPSPLPEPPEVPPGYTDALRAFASEPSRLDAARQGDMLKEARALVAAAVRDEDADGLQELAGTLRALRDRGEVTADTSAALEDLLQEIDATSPGGADPSRSDGGKWKMAHFPAPRVDVWKLARHLVSWYETQGMKADATLTGDGRAVVHCHSIGRARATGAGAKLTVLLAHEGDDLTVAVGGGRWKDKVASAGVAATATAMTGGFAFPLLGASVLGTYRQGRLPAQTIHCVEEMLPLCNR